MPLPEKDNSLMVCDSLVALACSTCHKEFATKKQLNVHQYLLHGVNNDSKGGSSKPLKNEEAKRQSQGQQSNCSNSKKSKVCKICKEVFPLVRDLVEHHLSAHAEHKFFRCQVCDKQFSWRDNLEKHMTMHENPHHTCLKCGRGFWNAQSLTAHTQSYHQDKMAGKQYSCQICGRAFEYDFTFQAHMSSHEGYVLPDTPTQPKTKRRSNQNTISASDGRHNVTVEFLKTTPTSTSSKTSPVKRRKYEKYKPAIGSLDMSNAKPFVCEICRECFRWKISLEIHKQQHEDDELELSIKGVRKESITYTKRGQAAISRIVPQTAASDEEGHEEDLDEDDLDQSVIDVPAAAVESHPLTRPSNSVHNMSVAQKSDVGSFFTPLLSETSDTVTHLYSVGFDKEQCSLAVEKPAAFGRFPRIIAAHLRWQRMLGQLRRALVCKLCPYVASTPALMRRHSLGHLASYFMYPCSKCGEGFPFQRELVLHKVLHQSTKKHRCAQCSKCFNRMAVFRKHRRRHACLASLKLLRCSGCCRRFVQKHVLEEHERVHHVLSYISL